MGIWHWKDFQKLINNCLLVKRITCVSCEGLQIQLNTCTWNTNKNSRPHTHPYPDKSVAKMKGICLLLSSPVLYKIRLYVICRINTCSASFFFFGMGRVSNSKQGASWEWWNFANAALVLEFWYTLISMPAIGLLSHTVNRPIAVHVFFLLSCHVVFNRFPSKLLQYSLSITQL